MKDSGVAWIGEIPNTWQVFPLKDTLRFMSRGAQPTYANDTDFFITNQACLSTYQMRPEKKKECDPLSGVRGRYKQGDVLVASTGEGVLGRCVLSEETGYCDSHVSILRPKILETGKFIFYWLSVNYETVNSLFAKGSTKQTELQKESFLAHKIAFPPLSEQHAIANHLDRQTAQIDQRLTTLAEKKAVLAELRKAIIHVAVTKGLNKAAPMKDSGVAWIGEVPSHWKIIRLGYLFREAADAGVADLPILSVSIHSGISDKELGDEEMDRKVSRSKDPTFYKRVRSGDLVYNQMRAWQGAFGAAKVEGLVSPAYVVARPGKAVVPYFIEYLLRAPSAMEEIRCRSRGITDFRLRLYWEEFKNIWIALPPKEEQRSIAEFLDHKLSQINAQLATLDEQAQVLKELRKAIIHEAVTGKIDLAGYTPPPQQALAA